MGAGAHSLGGLAPRGRSRGVSLVEVLVALLVLSVGLLGNARLHLLGLRSNHGSFVRGQAVQLAGDMADRMRANRFALRDADGAYVGFYNSADDATYRTPTDRGCSQTGGAAAGVCTVGDMAAHDLFEWRRALGARLPAGLGTVCLDSTPDDGTGVLPLCDGLGTVYAVKVWWTEIEPTGPAAKRYVLRFSS